MRESDTFRRYGKRCFAGGIFCAGSAAAGALAAAGDAGTGAGTCLSPVPTFSGREMYRGEFRRAVRTVSGASACIDPGIFLYFIFADADSATQPEDCGSVFGGVGGCFYMGEKMEDHPFGMVDFCVGDP